MKKIILILPILLIMTSSTLKVEPIKEQGGFAHIVFFWLKNPDNQSDRKSFEESLTRFINNSKYIQTKHIGIPADTDRDVIDNSYTYNLMLTFKDKATQDAYQAEDVHLKFIEESSNLWEKVLVYDSESILE